MLPSLILGLACCAAPGPGDYFAIQVVDLETGRGVPLVELRTVNEIKYFTDSNGLVAFLEPGLMDQEVFFHVNSHGYELPPDGFGFRGRRLKVQPGGQATIEIQRKNIAQRLYRMTGQGIYRDTVLLGRKPPTEHAVLNGQVLGSDSVFNAFYRGKLYWFWGDTNRPSYPLGLFQTPGATSKLPADGGLDPDAGVNLTYFVDEGGFAKGTCAMPGKGPTWIDGLIVLRDGQRERMFAHYAKINPPLETYQDGLVEWDPEQNEFAKLVEFPTDAPTKPGGHAFLHTVGDRKYVYFPKPYPWVRVPARPEALTDLSQYEAYTCLLPDDGDKLKLDRDDSGKLRFAWRQGAAAFTPEMEQRLLRDKTLDEREAVFRLTDVDGGKLVRVHGPGTSFSFNPYRGRWVMLALQLFGTSALGELWYAESHHPEGPWTKAKKILTHDQYSFYNPLQHPVLAQHDGRVIYFEGTYTISFSGNKIPTPRYEYNQMMYKLDLSDERLKKARAE